jgi:hypothetical protein
MTVQGAVSVRAAQPEDLDAVTNVALASLPADPAWPYRYPYAEQFPDEHYKYTRIRYAEYLENVQAGVYAAMVAELPSKNDPQVREIVAISMWQLPEIFSETGIGLFLKHTYSSRLVQIWLTMKFESPQLSNLQLTSPTDRTRILRE